MYAKAICISYTVAHKYCFSFVAYFFNPLFVDICLAKNHIKYALRIQVKVQDNIEEPKSFPNTKEKG